MSDSFFQPTVLGDIFDGVGSFLGSIINIIISAVNFIWQVVSTLLDYVVTAFKAIGTLFAHIWDNFFKKIFVSTYNALRSLSVWLESHLRPIIDWLKKAQKYILDLYTKYVKPILAMIQHIRQFLTILRALHIQWAADLDSVLGKVQSDINGIFLKITGTLNAVIDVLNIVTDPSRFLRHPTLVLSVRRSIYALIRQLTGLPPGFWIPSRAATSITGIGKLPRTFNAADPAQNPPASYYMGVPSSVPSLGEWSSGLEVPDDYGDDVPALDFFSSNSPRTTNCIDGVVCFLQAVDDARIKA